MKNKALFKSLDENKNTKITDYAVGMLVHFKDGEVWKVVEPSKISTGLFNRKRTDEISIKPYNDLAKKRNVSLAIEVDLNYLNDNVTKIVKESIDESASIKIEKLSDIDHTRIIKWMNGQFDSKNYDMKKSGSGFEIDIHKLSKSEQEDLMSYLKSQSYIKESEVNEGRAQIKRKYGEHGAIRVNSEAPIRNSILEFVGKRFVTEEEMKAHLTKLSEDRGSAVDQTKWFSRNMKYFESFENRGAKVWTLSKYGKRVLENIIKSKQEKTMIKESIGLFKFDSVNESIDVKYWEDYNKDTSGQGKKEHEVKSKDFEDTFEDAVVYWNQEADGAENRIKGAQIQTIKKLAQEFFKKAGWISSNVIQAMIAQES